MPSAECNFEHWLQIACAIFAFLAAITWVWASVVKSPGGISQEEMAAVHGDIISVFDRLMKAVTIQSRRNAVAAFFAALAAACQACIAFMPSCWSGSPFFG